MYEVAGSSPLSRGIRVERLVPISTHRIIPALAGNTPRVRNARGLSRDHPRSRGEYPSSDGVAGIDEGSSPLSRGIRLIRHIQLKSPGIIPALAGNTGAGEGCEGTDGDHPRSRGEYRSVLSARHCDHGSSPLSRGIPTVAFCCSVAPWIIPALAGNTVVSAVVICWARDHPRSRGEYQPSVSGQLGGNGSSPLSRGIHCRACGGAVEWGIIPALAGNTRGARKATLGRADHPRSRGEYEELDREGVRKRGSSPLSRGIRDNKGSDEIRLRIIPALAGNTNHTHRDADPSTDHPRSRGEYSFADCFFSLCLGSSPLSRGIR